MKIAVVVNELNVRGGTHKQVLRLCQYFERQNIDFILCTKFYEPKATYAEFQDIDIRYLTKGTNQREAAGYNPIKRVKNFFAARRESQKLYDLLPDDVDVINVHDCFLEEYIRLAIKAGNKVVWQINDLDPAFMVGNSKSQKDSIFNKRRRYIIRKIAKKVDAITVNVSKNADRVRKLLKREASVLYCGVDKNSMLKRHCFCAEKNEFRLLSMGVFFPYRNYETLILLINRLRKEGKNIRLDIIGNTNLDQGYFAKIKALVSEYKLNEYIKIWGQVDEEGYADLFNRADAFAFVNIDQSWGLAVFEAMSCGLPTVVSNSVGATELLHNGVDSMIVEPTDVDRIHDIVGRLMEDAAYYNKISRAAADTVKEYSWDALYSSKLLEIIKTL